MGNDSLHQTGPATRPLWFTVLLLLDAFTLGGLAVWRFVLNVLESKMVDPLRVGALDMLVGIDHSLFPYWFGHTGLALVLILITAASCVWLRTQSKLVSSLTLIVPIALVVLLWTSRI